MSALRFSCKPLVRTLANFALPLFTLAILGAADAPKGRVVTATMANMSYGALPADLHVGDTIQWVNNDTVAHTVTARDHSFDVRLAPHEKKLMALSKVGNFPFFCIYHSMMRGTLHVAAISA